MASRPAFWSALKEGVVIFVGVLVALVADDWRTKRADVREAENSLRVIADDLAQDSAQFGLSRGTALAHESASRWIFENRLVAEPDPDSVLSALDRLENLAGLQVSRAGYEGIRASNRLDLIIDDELRSAVIEYYEVLQPDTEEYFETVYGRRERLLESMYPFVERQSFPNDSAPAHRPVPRSSWRELVADPVVIAQVSRYGGSAWALRRDLGWMQGNASSLRAGILEHLDER